MTLTDVLLHYGDDPTAPPSSWLKTAAAIEKTCQTLANWKENRSIPRHSQLSIQALSDGKLTADRNTSAVLIPSSSGL